uniref:Uncharacterized protein n=1 Tax=Trichogramma kaykai TaxID=54128 RepID=A0ABD2XJS9_9HYME
MGNLENLSGAEWEVYRHIRQLAMANTYGLHESTLKKFSFGAYPRVNASEDARIHTFIQPVDQKNPNDQCNRIGIWALRREKGYT